MATRTKSANINVRLYPEIKQQAEEVFAYHGLSLPEAITVFITRACHVGGFPFEMRNPDYLQDSESLEALAESKLMKRYPGMYKSFSNAAELIADCLEGDDDDD
jgi:DNA-damage-inducible protein J